MANRTFSPAHIYPVLRYRDARAAIDWLGRAFGLVSNLEIPDESTGITHAELRLGADMIMLTGSRTPNPANPWSTERGGIYVAIDDVDLHHLQAVAAGAQVVRPLSDTSYGAREYSVRDIEGHLWSFGTYDPRRSAASESGSSVAPTEALAEFQAIEDGFNAAIISNDTARISEYVTEDWCLVTPEKGPVHGADVLAAIKAGVLSHDTMNKLLTRAVVYGDFAIVTGRGQNTGRFRGEPISADEWVTDTYRRIGGRWKCCLTHLTPVSG